MSNFIRKSDSGDLISPSGEVIPQDGFLLSTGEVVSELPKRNTRERHVRPLFRQSLPSMTKQEFKDECDVNNLIKRFDSLPLSKPMISRYADVSSVPSFLDALNIVQTAQEEFSQLPSKIRGQFENDPAKFLDFVSNPDNEDELVRMGIKIKPIPTPIPEPQKVIIVNSEPPKA